MVNMIKVFLINVMFSLYSLGVEGSLFTISDDRIRSLDISPVLGRGYSIMTNAFHSTCLIVEEVTTPSYNYDYFFTDFTSSSDRESSLSGKVSTSLAYNFISASSSTSSKSTSKVKTQTRTIIATMRIERYYSSTREEVTELSTDAKQLLTDEDYVGFFKACGPNYVRGIRRAQEVMAQFQFESSSRETSKQFATSMKASYWLTSGKASFAGKSKFKSASSSLKITIKGWGMGLSQEGSETLVAQSLPEYNKVMKFAFKSMTQLEDSYNVGQVYGIEIVPWVHNVAFQSAAKLQDADILIPMPRNLIPRALVKAAHSAENPLPTWSNDDTKRGKFECKSFNFKMDKFGYCCEPEQMYDLATKTYRPFGTETKNDVCRPIQSLDKSLIKDNMSNNGEFVARLDSALRYRFTAMAVLEKCISAANSIPDKFLDHVLKSIDTVKHRNTITAKVTLRNMKLAIDPKGDYSYLKHIGKELDEWIEMFYSPCMAALFGSNIGTTPDVDANYFMAYPWYHHEECMYLTCLTSSLRWNRHTGGCEPGMFQGLDAAAFVENNDGKCAKNGEPDGPSGGEKCKHDQEELKASQDSFTPCWGGAVIGNVGYFVTHYCMPQVTSETTKGPDARADPELTRLAQKLTYDTCRANVKSTTSRRLSSSDIDESKTTTPQLDEDGKTRPNIVDLKARIDSSRMKQ